MHLYQTHTCRGIIQEQWLSINLVAPLLIEIGTTIYLLTITVNHLEVIAEVHAIIHQSRMDVIIEVPKVDSFRYGFHISIIHHLPGNLIQQIALVEVAVSQHFSH